MDGATERTPEQIVVETNVATPEPQEGKPIEHVTDGDTGATQDPGIPDGSLVIDGVVLDPNTLQVLGEVPEEPVKGTQTPEPAPAEPVQTTPDGKAKYTTEELRTLDWQELDTSRLPDEAVPIYKSLQSSFTRKSQEVSEQTKSLNERKAELDRILEQAKGIPQGEQKSTNSKAQQYQELHNIVVSRVCQDLGVSPDEFDMYDPIHRLAYDDTKATLQKGYEEHRQKETTQSEQQSFLGRVEQEIRAFEPNFDDIQAYSEEFFDSLTRGEVKKIQADIQKAVKESDPKPLKALNERIRKSYYAKQKGFGQPYKETPPAQAPQKTISTPPPEVLNPGGGKVDKAKPTVDPTVLRHMTTQEIADTLLNAGLGDI